VLKDSILKFLKLESLIENLTGYVETRIELTKMEIREDLAKALANFLLFILLGVVFTFFLILISIAVAPFDCKINRSNWGVCNRGWLFTYYWVY
jgi:uncharacterized membrane protein YqjE